MVIVEWGAGMLHPGGSWLEIVIERPLGEDDDDSIDWSEAPVEQRTMTLTGYGPRWAEGILA